MEAAESNCCDEAVDRVGTPGELGPEVDYLPKRLFVKAQCKELIRLGVVVSVSCALLKFPNASHQRAFSGGVRFGVRQADRNRIEIGPETLAIEQEAFEDGRAASREGIEDGVARIGMGEHVFPNELLREHREVWADRV